VFDNHKKNLDLKIIEKKTRKWE